MSTKTKADRLLKIPCGGTKYYCPYYGCYEFDCEYECDCICENCIVTAGRLYGCIPNTAPPFYNPIDNKRVGKKVLKRILAIRLCENNKETLSQEMEIRNKSIDGSDSKLKPIISEILDN